MPRHRKPKGLKSNTSVLSQRSFDRIGYMDAESDEEFLRACFVEVPQYDRITSLSSPESVLSGRTGAGKSAILWAIRNRERRVIDISPKDLAIDYIVGSDVLRLCQKLNVKLNIFFEYLWRHLFIVELLKHYFDENRRSGFADGIQSLFGVGRLTPAEREAKAYLEKYGASFWSETVDKITELTRDLESKVSAETGLDSNAIKAVLGGSKTFKESRRKEVHRQIETVINQLQIRELSNLSDVLANKIFGGSSAQYFILIDHLDEDWVDNDVKYKLIRALIETTKWIRKLRRVKVVVALRVDHLEKMFLETRDPGFQREKYNDQIITLVWSAADLRSVMHRRFEFLIGSQGKKTDLYDIIPKEISQKRIEDYIIARTAFRPRDLISFINEILKEYRPGQLIGKQKIEIAERRYSNSRVGAIAHEWSVNYPCAETLICGLEGVPKRLSFNDLEKLKADEITTDLAANGSDLECEISQLASRVFSSRATTHDVMVRAVSALYQMGCLGIRDQYSDQISYTDEVRPFLEPGEVSPGLVLVVHPMLWSRLGTSKPMKGVVA